jgi:sortase A
MRLRVLGRYWLLIVGVVCLGLYSYAFVERVLYQTYQGWEFDRAQDRRASAIFVANDPTAPVGQVLRASLRSLPSRQEPSPAGVIGRISIPRLHLSAMVREGVDTNTLLLAVGHIPATALPGEAGNIGLAGHRDTFFRGLKDLRTTDEIQFSTLGGNFRYVVESLVIVEPDNAAALAPSTGNVLTLVTCFPFSYIGNAPKRFVARAIQVAPETVPPSTVE